MNRVTRNVAREFVASALLGIASCLAISTTAVAGQVFVSGHDPDFHATLGGNALGARHIIQRSLGFVRNGNPAPFLFLETDPAPNNALGDHTDSGPGLIASGFTSGVDFVRVNAAQFAALPSFTPFSAIFVPSDHGGSLMEGDLQALNARSGDVINYLNAGGGLVAFAEDGFHAPFPGAPPRSPLFGFLPFLVTSAPLSQTEVGNTVTPFGASLGLTNNDINGNASHNIFTATGGLNIVDVDASGEILSLAFQGQIRPGGVVPEPSTWVTGSTALLIGLGSWWRRRAIA